MRYRILMPYSGKQEFGILISTILPGFIAIVGFADHSDLLRVWLGEASINAPSVGGFLFLTVASVFMGLTIGTIRWAIVDWLHHKTGLNRPNWQFKNLNQKEHAFSLMIEIHYRYYQFYSNSIIAILFFLVGRWAANGFSITEALIGLVLIALFFAGSRDTLIKYYARVDALLSS